MVCLAKEGGKAWDVEVGGPVYLRKMEDALGRPPVAGKIFGGRMIVSELEEQERKRTEAFHKKAGIPFEDIDIMSGKEVDEFVQDIKDKTNL